MLTGAVVQGFDSLGVEAKALLGQGQINTCHPFHFALALYQLPVFRVVDVDAIAAQIFGHITGRVGSAQQARKIGGGFVNGHQANAGTNPEGVLLPAKVEVLNRLLQRQGDELCVL